MEMNIEDAKKFYIQECHDVGLIPVPVTYMTYDHYSEKYTLGNDKDGDLADLEPNGKVVAMHWNTKP